MRSFISTRLILTVIAAATVGVAAASGADPDKDPQLVKLLEEARHLIDTRKPTEALPKCDAVISAFSAFYGNSKMQVFCARTSAESLGMLLKAAVDKTNAITLSSTWSGAYFIKGYALQELHQLSEAKVAVQSALKLSPLNSQYLAEIGEIYSLEKNWAKAEQAYREAEDNAPLSPEASKADEIARARRGLGYVLVERGKLDEAEKKYQQCLTANPNDSKANAELEFIRKQKAKLTE